LLNIIRSQIMNVLKEIPQVLVNVKSSSHVFSSLLMGAGFCYSIENKKYAHIPIIFLFPATYAGYHMYQTGIIYKPYVIHFATNLQRKLPSKYCWGVLEDP
jgi:hypothetical protein